MKYPELTQGSTAIQVKNYQRGSFHKEAVENISKEEIDEVSNDTVRMMYIRLPHRQAQGVPATATQVSEASFSRGKSP